MPVMGQLDLATSGFVGTKRSFVGEVVERERLNDRALRSEPRVR